MILSRFALGMLPFVAIALATDSPKIDELLTNGKKFDKKIVMVTGKVDKFEQKTSRAGNDYYVFKLVDNKSIVNIYGQGKLAKPPKDGMVVQVTGFFQVEKKLGDRVFKNEIDLTPPKSPKKDDPAFGIRFFVN